MSGYLTVWNYWEERKEGLLHVRLNTVKDYFLHIAQGLLIHFCLQVLQLRTSQNHTDVDHFILRRKQDGPEDHKASHGK